MQHIIFFQMKICYFWHISPKTVTNLSLPALSLFEIFFILYVNEVSLPFKEIPVLVKGIVLIFNQLARFGLGINMEKGDKPSKT